jgi:hypothetical protein
MMRARLWKLHQWLGLLSCIGILMWGLSGTVHPIMSRLQPKPAAFMPPGLQWDAAATPSPKAALSALGITRLVSLHTVQFDGRMHWLAHASNAQPGVLLDAQTGAVIPQGEARLAEALARHYTGLQQDQVTSVRLVTAFDDDYLPVNKLLPVWQVRFAREDHLDAYIDTRQMRLATLSDDTKRALGRFFRWAHTWAFIDDAPGLQLASMSTLLACIGFSALTGLYFWWAMRASAGKRLAARPMSRWHRRLGLIVALTSLTFSGSGAYHLWHGALSSQAQATVAAQARPVSDISDAAWQALQQAGAGKPMGRVDWVAFDGGSAWWSGGPGQGPGKAQVAALAQASPEHEAHAHHHHGPMQDQAPGHNQALLIDAQGHAVPDAARTLARALARQHSGLPAERITQIDMVSRFDGEYGFLNKRLPVWRVAFDAPGHPRYYVEPGTGALAARVDDSDAREGWSFSTLHKWNIGDINKDLRDVLGAAFALGNVCVALMGLMLFLRRR